MTSTCTGEHFTAAPQWPVRVPGGTPVPVYVAAMGPKALQVTGELADGTLPYLAGPRTIAEFIVPTIAAAAAGAGRPTPRIIAAVPVLVTDDRRSRPCRRGRRSRLLRHHSVVPEGHRPRGRGIGGRSRGHRIGRRGVRERLGALPATPVPPMSSLIARWSATNPDAVQELWDLTLASLVAPPSVGSPRRACRRACRRRSAPGDSTRRRGRHPDRRTPTSGSRPRRPCSGRSSAERRAVVDSPSGRGSAHRK